VRAVGDAEKRRALLLAVVVEDEAWQGGRRYHRRRHECACLEVDYIGVDDDVAMCTGAGAGYVWAVF
jgi:hypothetical protein